MGRLQKVKKAWSGFNPALRVVHPVIFRRYNDPKKTINMSFPSIRWFLLFILFLPLCVQAQDFQVPANIVLKQDADYAKYKQEVLDAINWLEYTPLNEQTAKRKEVNAFLVQWISGCPTISVKMYAETMVFYDANPDLMMSYMGGWTKYALENPGNTDDFMANMAGLHSVIKVYKAGKGIKKDAKTDKLVKLEKEGKLETWAKAHFKD